MKRYKRLPYYCPGCKTEMSESVFKSDLEEFGEVICPVCKEHHMVRRDKDDTRDK
jgi:uncharacterized Zn finger protein (UPF0148 family)